MLLHIHTPSLDGTNAHARHRPTQQSFPMLPTYVAACSRACTDMPSNTRQLKKYLDLPQKGAVMAEYVWIDGSNGIRSKSKVRFFFFYFPLPSHLGTRLPKARCDICCSQRCCITAHRSWRWRCECAVACLCDVASANRNCPVPRWRFLSRPHDKPATSHTRPAEGLLGF